MATILIIEKNQEIRENLAELLEFELYQTIATDNKNQGVELAVAHLPDLILCDLTEADDIEIAKTIRQNPVTRLIRFIFLSARVKYAYIRAAMVYADDYLFKPFKWDDLLGAIAAQLQRAAEISELM